MARAKRAAESFDEPSSARLVVITLGIETSCDETSVALLRDGREILANVVSSQVRAHAPYGGVVPEIASRQHLKAFRVVLDRALAGAGIPIEGIDEVAVTRGPGLIGALLVGLCAGKGIAFARRLPLKGVHHLEGHIAAVGLSNPGAVTYPALALVVSGGHTHLYAMAGPHAYEMVARTLDDAAGEAFDKVGKALGMDYPAGPAIDRIAEGATPGRVSLPRPRAGQAGLDMSFSGLKTAALRVVAGLGPAAARDERAVADLLAEFRQAVVDILLDRVATAAAARRPRCILVTGGVAANRLLRRSAHELGQRLGIPVLFPEIALTSDNGAMIAAAGHARLHAGAPDSLALDAVASWDLLAA